MARDNRKNTKGEGEDLCEKLIAVNRVSKSTKGGRTISFAALMVVGDKKGRVGFGLGKANDVSEAIKKATNKAKKDMSSMNLKRVRKDESMSVTIPHEIMGKYKSACVLLRPATAGTGVIAGSGVRAVCDAVGITDILSKSLGSNNKGNMIKATLDGLKRLFSVNKLALARGVTRGQLFN